MPPHDEASSPVGIIAAGSAMPFAVADALLVRGRQPIIFGLTGLCDPVAITRYRHHWVALAKFGRLFRLLRAERCRDLVLIGSMARPAVTDLRFDLGTLQVLPDIVSSFRGGDDHVMTRGSQIFERRGFRMLGIHDIAPEMLVPVGRLTRAAPDAATEADIARGREVLRALSPFDIGQAVVVIDNHIVGVEGIEGTDGLLARIAQLRADRRIRKKPGRGVLVKGPKDGQDLRFDLPTVGPRTVEGIVSSELGGLAVVAQRSIAVEPQTMIKSADRHDVFIVGISP